MAKRSLADRFCDKYTVNSSTGCWEWTAGINTYGYGNFGPDKAHRWSYQHHFGPIPKGMFVCHKCDVRHCVNPDHLFLGTNQDNMDDMVNKGRQPKGEKNGRSKLTKQSVVLMKQFFNRHPPTYLGGQCLFLARWFNVSKQTASHIAVGRTWRHL